VVFPSLQAASEQRPHKLSYTFPAKPTDSAQRAAAEGEVQALREALVAAGLTAKVIYSGRSKKGGQAGATELMGGT
jgi:hypothetical protein